MTNHTYTKPAKATPTQTIRQDMRQRRRLLSHDTQRRSAFLAGLHLPKLLPLLPSHAKIGLYINHFGELPTAPILAFCVQHHLYPYLPITRPYKALLFASCLTTNRHTNAPTPQKGTSTTQTNIQRLTHLAHTPLKKHPLGMLEPNVPHHHSLNANQLNAIICPLVAIDKQGNRMGMGGGFYDRTFANTPNVIKIGWGYDFQLLDRLDTNPWDKKLDFFISEKGIVRF